MSLRTAAEAELGTPHRQPRAGRVTPFLHQVELGRCSVRSPAPSTEGLRLARRQGRSASTLRRTRCKHLRGPRRDRGEGRRRKRPKPALPGRSGTSRRRASLQRAPVRWSRRGSGAHLDDALPSGRTTSAVVFGGMTASTVGSRPDSAQDTSAVPYCVHRRAPASVTPPPGGGPIRRRRYPSVAEARPAAVR